MSAMSLFRLFPEVKKQLADRFPDLDLVADVRSEWGSLHDGHREKIRSAIGSHREFSISHSKGAGGFIAVSEGSGRSLPVGFDIEVRERIRPVVVQRILSKADEVRADAPMALLWSAKEAAFKAMKGFEQPPVISDISIHDLKPASENLWTFSFAIVPPAKSKWKRPDPQGFGFAWAEDSLQFSVCLRARR